MKVSKDRFLGVHATNMKAEDCCLNLGISRTTWYKWCRRYGLDSRRQRVLSRVNKERAYAKKDA